MRLDLNLAADPFRNRLGFWLGVAATGILLVVLGAVVLVRAGRTGAATDALAQQVADQEELIASLEAQLAAVKDEQSRAVFSDDDRRRLDDAHLLLERKGFSWTRLLSDLERHVPKDSRLTRITISAFESTGSQCVVNMEIDAVGRNANELTAFLASLDGSGGVFTAEPLKLTPPQNEPEYRYSVAIAYRPAPPVTVAEVAQLQEAQ